MADAPQRFRPNQDTFTSTFCAPLRYADYLNGATQAASADVYPYSLNSLYDPYASTGGTQPKFFTTLCAAAGGTAPYDSYSVVKAHFRVTVTSQAGPIYLYTQVYSDTAGIDPACGIQEYREVPNLMLVNVGDVDGSTGTRTIEGTVDIGQFLGVEHILASDYNRAQYNASPARQLYLDVGVRAVSDSSAINYTLSVQILYEAVFMGSNDTTPALRVKGTSVAPVRPVASTRAPKPVKG